MERSIRNKAFRNYIINISALLPFLLLLLTGVIMLVYHSGRPQQEKILFIDGYSWLQLHHIFTVIATPLVSLHIILHWSAILRLFLKGRKAKQKSLNTILLVLFIASVISGLSSWLFFSDEEVKTAFRAIHNKFGMALMVFFSVHLALYLNWLVRMTRKTFRNSED